LIESIGLRVETFGNANEFLTAYDAERPGCLLVDVRMPGMSGLELQVELRRRQIPLPIVVITGYAEVPTAVRAMKAGAVDFIEKPFSDEVLLDCLREAITRDARARTAGAERAAVLARVQTLTRREHELLEMVVAGMTNKEIARRLSLSQKTVEVHRASTMQKMRAGSLAELVRLALLARGESSEAEAPPMAPS